MQIFPAISHRIVRFTPVCVSSPLCFVHHRQTLPVYLSNITFLLFSFCADCSGNANNFFYPRFTKKSAQNGRVGVRRERGRGTNFDKIGHGQFEKWSNQYELMVATAQRLLSVWKLFSTPNEFDQLHFLFCSHTVTDHILSHELFNPFDWRMRERKKSRLFLSPSPRNCELCRLEGKIKTCSICEANKLRGARRQNQNQCETIMSGIDARRGWTWTHCAVLQIYWMARNSCRSSSCGK